MPTRTSAPEDRSLLPAGTRAWSRRAGMRPVASTLLPGTGRKAQRPQSVLGLRHITTSRRGVLRQWPDLPGRTTVAVLRGEAWPGSVPETDGAVRSATLRAFSGAGRFRYSRLAIPEGDKSDKSRDFLEVPGRVSLWCFGAAMQNQACWGHGSCGVHAEHGGPTQGCHLDRRLFEGSASDDARCNICDRDIHMTSQDSSANGSGLTKTEWELLLDAIRAYNHNADYRTLHGKLAILAKASGVRPKGAALTSGEAGRT